MRSKTGTTFVWSLRGQGIYFWPIFRFRLAANCQKHFLKTADGATKPFCDHFIGMATYIEKKFYDNADFTTFETMALDICSYPSQFSVKKVKIDQSHSMHCAFKHNATLFLATFYINFIPVLCIFNKKSVSHTFRFFTIYLQSLFLVLKR